MKIGCEYCAKGAGRRRMSKYRVQSPPSAGTGASVHACGYHLGVAVDELAGGALGGPQKIALVHPLEEAR